jgi:predicted nucleotidyltransferase
LYIRFLFVAHSRQAALPRIILVRRNSVKPSTGFDPITALQTKLGVRWPAIRKAHEKTVQTKRKIDKLLKGLSSTDASTTVFGSLARDEWTSKSDVDWTLLIDGQADPQHHALAREISARLTKAGYAAPGPTGIFGNMTFSHDLVQKIGGREDTNENTTRRVLLLQESVAIGKPDARRRVLGLILSRYLNEDYGFRYGRLPVKVPRFLLNDIVRYWRTVTVDFVEKQRGQEGRGWALRNAKLRMSRKLIFATGMLRCFSCELLSPPAARRELIEHKSTAGMEQHLRGFMEITSLQVLALFLTELKINPKIARTLFSSYNSFLALLDNRAKREHLKNLHPDKIGSDSVYAEVRTFTRNFQDALTALFFHDNKQLRDLTIFFGVF